MYISPSKQKNPAKSGTECVVHAVFLKVVVRGPAPVLEALVPRQ